MRKLLIMTSLGVGMLSVGALGSSHPASAAASHAPASGQHVFGEDGDDGDDEMWRGGGGGGGSGSSLPATGTDATSLALIGAVALVAGGATYRVATRRQPSR